MYAGANLSCDRHIFQEEQGADSETVKHRSSFSMTAAIQKLSQKVTRGTKQAVRATFPDLLKRRLDIWSKGIQVFTQLTSSVNWNSFARRHVRMKVFKNLGRWS